MDEELTGRMNRRIEKIGFREGVRFLIKNSISFLGSLLLIFIGRKVNKAGWEKRVLVIFGGGIGDVLKRSVVCGYLESYLKGYECYYLMPYPFELPYAKENITFDYTKAKTNPRYYADLVNRLRRIGFENIIVVFPFWEGFLSFLANDINPNRVFCHREVAPNPFFDMVVGISSGLRSLFLKKRIQFVRVISGWDANWPYKLFPSDVEKHAKVASGAIADIKKGLVLDGRGLLPLKNPHTEVLMDYGSEEEFMRMLKKEYGLLAKTYCVIGLGSSSAYKNWPVERFADVAKMLGGRGFSVVISEHIKDKYLSERFKELYPEVIDLTGKTDMRQMMVLIKNSRMLVANDTSFTHAAIALRTASVCVIGNAILGADSLYGYEKLNRWAYEPSPAGITVAGVPSKTAIKECENIFDSGIGEAEEGEIFQFQYGAKI